MEEENRRPNFKVCVTGGSGFIGSWLVKKLLERGHTVHATTRNLGETSKIGLLKSLPHAEAKLVIFEADIYKPDEFEAAIEGCQFVFHVATPLQHSPESSQYKDTTEAALAGVRSIAESCIRSGTVKRLIYTGSVMASSPLREDGSGYKPLWDESCWTPFQLPFSFSNGHLLGYITSKTLSEKEILSYNSNDEGGLEVVSLACGLVGGDTLSSHAPAASVLAMVSQLTGDSLAYLPLRFIQELLGSVPLVHIEDVCEAHLFCMEQSSDLRGRFLCAAVAPTLAEIANYYQKKHPQLEIPPAFMGEAERGSSWDFSKLLKLGFTYKYNMEMVLNDSVESARRLGFLSLY